ncbi:MAG: site-specific DNA-methyltransferase [Endomicrobium sp.]|jgi:16S rRNA G966 N2-methylase RsmD|nr:site-specific DNA-methyltransferase [Endomicrobium sp.]
MKKKKIKRYRAGKSKLQSLISETNPVYDNDALNVNGSDVNVDSLWLIKERDKSGKHKNVYHGNFIPQIPNQLIRRYTNENDVVLEPFAGSGTTLFECERLNRKYVGFDINSEIVDYVKGEMSESAYKNYALCYGDVLDKDKIENDYSAAKKKLKFDSAQFVIMHPPYMDIVKFTQNKNDLSQIGDIKLFVEKFKMVCQNILPFLETNKYFALVIGDVYKKSEVVPLSFYCMDMLKRNFKIKLKGIIVKNIEGNRGKLGQAGIWKYRALKSDYFLFKHEYVFVFKKEF